MDPPMLRRLVTEEGGVSTVELLLVLCLVLLTGVAGWKHLGAGLLGQAGAAQGTLGTLSAATRGEGQGREGERAGRAIGRSGVRLIDSSAPGGNSLGGAQVGLTATAGAQAPAEPGGLLDRIVGLGEDLVRGAVEGDAGDCDSFACTLGQVGVGFVPYLGQAADVRDLSVAAERGTRTDVAFAALGFIPGVGDGIKAIRRGLTGRRGMPAPRVPRDYELTPMRSDYAAEQYTGPGGLKVRYLDEQERAAYRVEVRRGVLYDANGKKIDTAGERGIFVMDERGDIYFSGNHAPGRFHHSSFLAGGPVAGAGEMVVRRGRIVGISDKSGHYRSGMDQTLERLAEDGVTLGRATRMER